MLGYSLVLGDFAGWDAFRRGAALSLTEEERAHLAYFALTSLSPELMAQIAATAIGAAGEPLPPFLGGMDEARSWAGWATQQELKAYAIASFEAMESKDQAAFYRRIREIKVAA